jgi:hypothetical protein
MMASRRPRIAIPYRASIYKKTIQHNYAIEQYGRILASPLNVRAAVITDVYISILDGQVIVGL